MRLASLSIVLVGGLGLALLPTLPAAADGYPPPPVGGGYTLGIPYADISECSEFSVRDRGGWNKDWFQSDSTRYSTTTSVGLRSERPVGVAIGEPCTGANDKGLWVGSKAFGYAVGNPTDGGLNTQPRWQSAVVQFDNANSGGPDFGSDVLIRCQASLWSKTSTQVIGNRMNWGSLNNSKDGGAVYSPGARFLEGTGSNIKWSATACPYLVSITFTLHTYAVPTTDVSPNVPRDDWTITWSAQRYADGTPYSAAGNPERALCWGIPTAEKPRSCLDLLPDPSFDGTDPALVCGDAPEMTWGDFGWLAESIGYYAGCLFNPANGWDPHGSIPRAWDSSAGGQLAGAITTASASFSFSDGCGVLTVLEFGSFTQSLDSCTWSSWAPPIKGFISVAILLAVSFWAVGFIVDNVTSVITKTRMDNPIKGGDD